MELLISNLRSGLSSFSCWSDTAFEELWCRDHLSTQIESKEAIDGFDKVNAALLWSAIEKRRRLLVGMPERLQHRPSALLATGLIKAFLDTRGRSCAKDVVYFGSRLGIREDLSLVTLRRKSLQEFFTVKFSRRDLGVGAILRDGLPRLICIYSPIDPVSSLQQTNPFLIAVDCGEQPDVPWLPAVLKYAEAKRIPMIAWCSNPLSEIHSYFNSADIPVFSWPTYFLHDHKERGAISKDDSVRVFGQDIRDIQLFPCELTGEDVDDYSNFLSQVQHALSHARSMLDGQVSRDAVLMGYRLLKLLERLPVSLSTYEFERSQYWRQPSIENLCSGFSRFANAMRSQAISTPLFEALQHLQKAVDWLSDHDPPLWTALVDLCIEDRELGANRILVFASEAHKKMFSHCLLAKEGVREQDLADMGVSVRSITGLVRALTEDPAGQQGITLADSPPSQECRGVPFLVGLPAQHSFRRIAPIVGLAKLEVLHYPHQRWYLKEFANKLNAMLTPNVSSALRTVHALGGGLTQATTQPSNTRQAVKIYPPRPVKGRSRPKERDMVLGGPLDIGTPTDELTRILAQYDDCIDEIQYGPVSADETGAVEEGDQASEFVDRALRVTFVDGWHALFGVNDRINFVRADHSIERRFARSARPRDRILYIHGESQQNLYELLISRVYKHPSIRTHVEYIRAWQQEAREKISAYLSNGHNLDDLLARLVQRGSTLQTPAALSFWARGWVMRPRDVEDLRRLSEVLDMPFTSKCYKLVHKAGDRLHGLHIQLSHRLKAWIMQGARGGQVRDEVIDQELQLTFGDVQDALILLEVVDAHETEGLFFKGTLGRIEKELST